MQGLIGKKVGMTRIANQETGEMTAVTIIEAAGNVVLQQKTVENDGYSSVQLGYEKAKEKNLSKAEVSHAKKYGAEAVRHVKEFDLDKDETPEAGQEVKVDIFESTRFVNVTGNVKGRGFTGTVKRYGFKIGRATHGNTNRRARGSLGAGTYPARVFPGLKMAGQHGAKAKTIMGLEIVSLDVEKGLIYIKGAVPGANRGIVYIKKNVVKG
jgi:large subunit ribosomal protein L3